MRDPRRGIARVQSHRGDIEAEACPLPVETPQVDDAVMHVGRRRVGIGNDAETAVHRPVVEVEEALRLAVAHHVAGIRIGARDPGLLHRRLMRLRLQWLPAVRHAVGLHRRVQRLPIVGARLRRLHLVVAVLVGIGLEMGRVGIQHDTIHQPVTDRLLHDPVEETIDRPR